MPAAPQLLGRCSLPYNWWIWGADIQFSKYLDASQVSYFETVAAADGAARTISSSAWPSRPGCWRTSQGEDEEENFFKITTIARKRGVRICAVIAGDWHHYTATSPTSSTFTSSRRAAAAPSCIPPTC